MIILRHASGRFRRTLSILTGFGLAGLLNACAADGLTSNHKGASAEARCHENAGDACTEAGMAKEYGAPPSPEAARVFYEKACELKDGTGCFNLGLLHYNGKGVAKDPRQAVTLWEKSCRLQTGQACYNLGALHSTGGTQQAGEAGALFQMACDLKYEQGCKSLGALFLKDGESHYAKKDFSEAYYSYKRGCEMGSGAACTRLGVMTQKGEGDAPRSQEEAAALFDKACAANDGAGCLNEATAAEKDGSYSSRTLALYEKACDADQPSACVELAGRYVRGDKGVRQNISLAGRYYELACAANDPEACFNAGQLHAAEAIPPKEPSANFYEKACRLGSQEGCKATSQEKKGPVLNSK